MGDSKLTRLRAKLLRRSSTSSAKAESSTFNTIDAGDIDGLPNTSNVSLSLNTEERQRKTSGAPKPPMSKRQSAPPSTTRSHPSSVQIPTAKPEAINTQTSPTPPSPVSPLADAPPSLRYPKVTLEHPTPEVLSREGTSGNIKEVLDEQSSEANAEEKILTSPGNPPSSSSRPNIAQRRQSLVPYSQTRLIKTLLDSERPPTSRSAHGDYFSGALPSIQANMISRKIWVKRPGASATLVTIHEDDVVDDVRDAILRKYTNSLGRSFDAPDVTLKIVSRDHSHSNRSSAAERVLGPEEPIGRTLDAYFPGGQTVEEALIIDVPQRRTPKPSPRPGHHMPQYYYAENIAPGEGGEYFPPMPAVPSPHFPPQLTSVSSGQGPPHHPSIHSMSVLTTGQIPPLPSPGTRGPRHQRRPNNARQHTSSPTTLTSNSPSITSERKQSSINGIAEIPTPPPLPTPPAAGSDPSNPHKAVTPPARVSSPRPLQNKSKKNKKIAAPSEGPSKSLPSALLDSTIPPINVLLVEDNIINLKLLEAFMRRVKVRWQTAMNGKEAVTKWRKGGFHLVLMDIQLPVMNGLDATKEIRRLERLNNIGAFSTVVSDPSTPTSTTALSGVHDPPKPDDTLDSSLVFKSPVIIVALTASSLQSDRHEALAAGCNDFLTKPVNFVWLERKVTEWGCMQALIDYDGWRQWKDFSSPPVSGKSPTSTKQHNSLAEALKSQRAKAENELGSSSKNSTPMPSKNISPTVTRTSSIMLNGSVKKGPPRRGRGNSISLAMVDGDDEEDI